MLLHRLAKVRAPEFPDGLTWLQGGPFTMRRLLGAPVLIDFWTYSCVNCQRTLPHLAAWHEQYAPLGLTILGVHTPEFAFEKDERHVARALARYNIPYPVVLDNDYAVWHAYANRWWPRKFLVNAEGVIVYDHVGEGGYAETEMAIQKALAEIGVKEFPPIASDTTTAGAACYRTTPETYLGYLRGHLGNAEEALPDAEEVFTDNGRYASEVPYLHGHWRVGAECVEHVATTAVPSEYLALQYHAFGVNLVMATAGGAAIAVEVELDGRPLSADMAGDDVRIAKDGRAVVTVKEARMYRLVQADTYHAATLRLRVRHAGVRMYAFTFESCG